MSNADTRDLFYDTIMSDYIASKNTQANKPVQTSQTSKPLEYTDLLKRRNEIGTARTALADALSKRDNFGYRFANALTQMPEQQGSGAWLGNLARAFGAAYNAKTDMSIDRAERDYENAQKDLATALAYDKAMGEEQTMGYMPVANTKATDVQQGQGFEPLYSVSEGFNPTEYYTTASGFDAPSRAEDAFIKGNSLVERLAVASGLPKSLQGKEGSINRLVFGDDVTKILLLPRVFEVVGGAGSVRIADTDDEKRYILGPLMNWQNLNNDQIGAELGRAEDRFVAQFYEKARRKKLNPADIATEEQVRARWRSMWSNPTKYIEQNRVSTGETKQDKTGNSFAEQFRKKHGWGK